MSLSVKDILLLDYFDNKPLHTEISVYKEKIYGKNTHERLLSLLDNGWIRYSTPKETLHMLPEKALSDFLSRHGVKSEGTKADLIRLIIQKIPEKAYYHAVPKVYTVTKKGRDEISHNMAYILNARENYGLSESEIRHWQSYLSHKGEPYNSRKVLERAMNEKASVYIMAGEWSKLRNLYYTTANFYLRSKDNENAVSYLFLVFFLDISGMRDKNRLENYEKLFRTPKAIILLIDELRLKLKISLSDMKPKFLSTIARMAPRLPFSYFSVHTSAFILTECLRGTDFSPRKYITERNVPDPSDKGYKFDKSGKTASGLSVRDFPFKVKKKEKLHIPVFVPPEIKKAEDKKILKKNRKVEKKEVGEKGIKKVINLISSFF